MVDALSAIHSSQADNGARIELFQRLGRMTLDEFDAWIRMTRPDPTAAAKHVFDSAPGAVDTAVRGAATTSLGLATDGLKAVGEVLAHLPGGSKHERRRLPWWVIAVMALTVVALVILGIWLHRLPPVSYPWQQ